MSRVSRPWRIALGIATAVLALNIALAFIRSLTGGTPGGRPSSSYATGPQGVAAYAELLERAGHPVGRLRRGAAAAELDPHETLVLLDPGFVGDEDAGALRRFVARGGRLLMSGGGSWVERIVPDAPDWSSAEVREPELLAPAPELAGVREVGVGGRGAWDGGGALPLLGSDDDVLLAVAGGPGRVLLLADDSPLQNRLLDEADNARLGLALAGGAGRPVRFLESYHGYGEATGIRAVPNRWWAAFALLFAAAIVLMLSRGRRLGPPQAPERDLPPPRQVYVESLAGVLARIRRRERALAPVQARAVRLIRDRGGLGPSPTPDELKEAGERLGLERDELEALLGDAKRPDVVAAGRALVRLARESRR